MNNSLLKRIRVYAFSVFLAEMLIMFLLSFLPPLPVLTETLIASVLVGIVFSLLICLVIIRQFEKQLIVLKDAEDRREKEARFRYMAEFATDAVICVDSKGIITFWNTAAETVFGYSAEEVINESVEIIIPENFQKTHKEAWEKHQAHVRAKTYDLARTLDGKGRKKDGTEFPLELSHSSWETAEGTFFTATIRDISERKRLEQEIANNFSELSAIYEGMPVAMVLVDGERRILKQNRAATEFIGRPEEESLQLRTGDAMNCVHSTDDPRGCGFGEYCQGCIIRNTVNRTLETGESYSQVESPLTINRDGEQKELSILISATPLRINDAPDVLLTFIDITERKILEEEREKLMVAYQEQYKIAVDATAELGDALSMAKRAEVMLQEKNEKLEAANRTKGEFLARMSHEIRTPIHSSMGMINLVLDTDLNGEQQEYLDTALLANESLLNIINDILDFSKIESGWLELSETPFNLHSTVGKVANMVSPLARKKGLDLFCRFADDVPEMLIGDGPRLSQVLLNLASNAIKFTAEGEVVIQVENKHEDEETVGIRFSVRDTGIGIDEDKQAHVFEDFYQVDGSDTRTYGGTGLGLAISEQLVKLMGGHIQVESGKDKGSNFYFTVEFKKQKAPARGGPVKKAETASALPQLLHGNILVAEDNATAQIIARKGLEKRGFNVHIAGDGLEVLEILKKEEFDLILMDVEMPHLNGLETTRKIREQEKDSGRHVPIIAMTAYAMREDRERCLNAGMDDYVSKPVDYEEVVQKVGKLLSSEKAVVSGETADIESALDMLDGDKELLQEAAQLFLLQDYPRHLEALMKAVREKDTPALAKAAHGIKGAAASLGAKTLSELAALIENSAKKEDSAAAEKALSDLESEMGRFVTGLKDAGIQVGEQTFNEE